MAEMPILTPKDGGEGRAEETLTPEPTPEGQEEKETPKTPSEGEESYPEEAVILKKRYADSSREAQRLRLENELLRTKLERQPLLTPSGALPSDEELSKSIPDWDLLSTTEQRLMKEQVAMKRRIAQLEGSSGYATSQLQWRENFDEIVKESEFKELAKSKSDFKHFCEQHPGTDTKVLARSFLFDRAKLIGAYEEKERLAREGLEKGTGGIKSGSKPAFTAEDEAYIQATNPKEYERLLKKGVFK